MHLEFVDFVSLKDYNEWGLITVRDYQTVGSIACSPGGGEKVMWKSNMIKHIL